MKRYMHSAGVIPSTTICKLRGPIGLASSCAVDCLHHGVVATPTTDQIRMPLDAHSPPTLIFTVPNLGSAGAKKRSESAGAQLVRDSPLVVDEYFFR